VQLSRPDPQNLRLSRLDGMLVELLRRIPRSADPTDSAAARARLFSAPTQDSKEKELLEDWPRYVEPELEKLFQSALEVIEGDLRSLHIDRADGEAELAIPVAHLENWIHGMNQARLALAARHDFTEEDLERPLISAGDARSLALLQMHFYGMLQELFLRELEGD
jgi:hypothetical protein